MSDRPARPAWWFVVALLALTGVHMALALSSARQTSPTFDEPLHLVGAWTRLAFDDHRVNPEDPPLFHRWVALAIDADDLAAPPSQDSWDAILVDVEHQWRFVHETLYDNASVDAHALVQSARTAMVAWSAMLVLVVGATGRMIARSLGRPGEFAGLLAAAIVAFDPSVLAHGALVKNDVALTACFALLIPSIWLVCVRASPARIALLAGASALCLTIKFSGVFALPVVAIALLARAMLGGPWLIGSTHVHDRRVRLAVSACFLLLCSLVAWGSVWAAYGFRYRATGDGRPLDMQSQDAEAQRRQFEADAGRVLSPDEWARVDRSMLDEVPTARRLARLGESGLVPEAWAFGLAHVHARSLSRPSYLLGDVRVTGWWYYYPLAFAFKTPVALIALVLLAAALAMRNPRAWSPATRIAAIAVIVPGAVYAAFAMTSAMNMGIRHFLPVYPSIALAVGLVMATRQLRWARGVSIALVALAAVESIARHPHHLAFFNLASGGSRGGLMLLADSNLDWGQDLPLLAQWQNRHPDTTLYLTYFGSADPASYGIRYRNVPPGYAFNPTIDGYDPAQPGVLAVSATTLQSIFRPDLRPTFERIAGRTPREVLGGTIYLYDWPFTDQGD